VSFLFLLAVGSELGNAYSQIGWAVLFLIVPFVLIAWGIIYFRKRNEYKNRL
jgi:hypothetical protein